MIKTDEVYLNLVRDIMENGVEKDTRAGKVKSVFGRQVRFDLKREFPLLTTKKVFTKGVLHELLWFLQRPYNSHGSMNIEYLVRNGVHIWDDDAYRWYKEWVKKNREELTNSDYYKFLVCTGNDEQKEKPNFEHWIEGSNRKNDIDWFENLTKEEFLDLVTQKVEIQPDLKKLLSKPGLLYRFGDLGPVYGTQWRAFGNGVFRNKRNDQINNIINTLKTNPNDRRMLCLAFNPDQLNRMALPPCHVMMQFYTRPLSKEERMKIFNQRYMTHKIPRVYFEWFDEYSKDVPKGMDVKMPDDGSDLDIADIPKYGLSCMYTMRSNDIGLGWSFNVVSYSLLTYMIAKLVNMIPDELIASLGDCHIYLNHIDALKEQMTRNGSDIVPQLLIEGNQKTIEDFKYEDFHIFNYEPDPPIKMPLSVG